MDELRLLLHADPRFDDPRARARAEIVEALGRNLALVRRRVGLSQKELAALCSLHRTASASMSTTSAWRVSTPWSSWAAGSGSIPASPWTGSSGMSAQLRKSKSPAMRGFCSAKP